MRISIILFIFMLSSLSFGQQNSGFIGKKTTVEFNGIGNFNLFPNLIQKKRNYYPKFKNDNGKLVESKDRFDGGLEIGIQRTMSRHFGLSLYGGVDNINVGFGSSLNSIYVNNKYYGFEHERIKVRGFYFIPTLEFVNEAGMLPMGIVHQLGLGFRWDKPIEKDYLYTIAPPSNAGQPDTTGILDYGVYNYDNPAIKSWSMNYSVRMRHPLNDNFFLNYGLRYTFTFYKGIGSLLNLPEEGYLMSNTDMIKTIRSRRVTSFIKLSVGLSYVF